MRNRSNDWIQIINNGQFQFEAKLSINGKDYTHISAPKIERVLMSEALSVGNCSSATLSVSILTDDSIPTSATVTVSGQITDGNTYSEWLEFGTFFIDTRSTEYEGLVTLKCYDAILKANQDFLDETSISYNWPKPMSEVVEEIADRIGVDIDPRTHINSGDGWFVTKPAGLTMMQVLGYIGACHGGNWIITENNALRLVPLNSSSIAPVTDALAVLGKLSSDTPLTVSGVSMVDKNGNTFTAGNTDGAVISVKENPYASQEICDNLYSTFANSVYTPFDATKAIYDPAVELGDSIAIGDIHAILFKSSMTLDTCFIADISAPNNEELKKEYPYLSEIKKVKMEIEEISQNTETEITQLTEKTSDFSKAINNALGLHMFVETSTTDGSMKIYFGNGPTLAESTYIYTYTGDGIAFVTGVNCWNNGQPNWQYGVTKDGNAILNILQAYKITADVIEAGILTSVDGKTYFDLDNSEIVTTKTVEANDIDTNETKSLTTTTIISTGAIAVTSKNDGEDEPEATAVLGSSGLQIELKKAIDRTPESRPTQQTGETLLDYLKRLDLWTARTYYKAVAGRVLLQDPTHSSIYGADMAYVDGDITCTGKITSNDNVECKDVLFEYEEGYPKISLAEIIRFIDEQLNADWEDLSSLLTSDFEPSDIQYFEGYCRVKKVCGVVYLQGCVKPSRTLTGSGVYTIFTLPQEYRPSNSSDKHRIYVPCVSGGAYMWTLMIDLDGNVRMGRFNLGGTYVNPDETYPLPFNLSFPALDS